MFNTEIIKKALLVLENHARVKAPFNIDEVTAILYYDTTLQQLEVYRRKNCHDLVAALEQEVEDYLHILTEQNLLTNNAALNHLILIDKLVTKWQETISEIDSDYQSRKKLAANTFNKIFINNSA